MQESILSSPASDLLPDNEDSNFPASMPPSPPLLSAPLLGSDVLSQSAQIVDEAVVRTDYLTAHGGAQGDVLQEMLLQSERVGA